ncbi:TBC1 domain family member 12-like [Cylas formicarius]|uniref:TBC1 domain family member 12-like n=1 Tax=Cylas formicarius TaxID=197179 RepID=UPI002958CF0F|nr:TBC1 domain family member 12-like [Cylas formicarius]
MTDLKYSSRDTLTDSLIADSKATKNVFRSNLKLSLGLKNGYKSIQSKSNEDLYGNEIEPEEPRGNVGDQDSPVHETWFKTWPERCDKIKSADSSPERDVYKFRVGNRMTLNEALKNISLAYSPVTKKLHLIETRGDEPRAEPSSPKKGHKRTEAGSFSSTVSEPSTSGSIQDMEDRSLMSVDESETRKTSLADFFTKSVFAWKLFKTAESASSPTHKVASSSALIQHKRPHNLPAKPYDEEQRHADEYNAILAAAKRKEAKDTATKQRRQKLQLQLEEQQAAAAKHFAQHVIPNWTEMEKTKKTQELWWRGLPSSVRGRVWKLAIGNELNVTPQLYEICVSRAQSRLNRAQGGVERGPAADRENSLDVIELDISRTFPNLGIFQQGRPYSDALHSLLAAYACFRPDVGYVQGMSYIAAVLILNMDPCDAFVSFANLLNQPLHLAAFTLNQTQMQTYYRAYDLVFNGSLPRLYSHFEAAGLTPDLYLLDWIYTIYAKAMPLDVACRVWDVFLRDGAEFIFRAALGILHLYESTLLTMDFLHGAQFLTRLPDEMSSEQLFKSIQCVSTSLGKMSFGQVVQKCCNHTAVDAYR